MRPKKAHYIQKDSGWALNMASPARLLIFRNRWKKRQAFVGLTREGFRPSFSFWRPGRGGSWRVD